MVPYGFVVTDLGRSIIAGWTAGSIASSLALAEVMVGSGTPPDDWLIEDMYGLTDMILPFAKATSTVPTYNGSTVQMTIEYRSDLNGGLEEGMWLSEFGIYIEDPKDAGKKILFGYGTLGDKPQYVSAYNTGSIDIRRFPVSITIGAGVDVSVHYDTTAFLTSDEVEQFCNIVILPEFLAEVENLISIHNQSITSHPDIRKLLNDIVARMGRIEDMFMNDITQNPFIVTFTTLDGKTTTGVWNKSTEKMEF